VHAATEAGAGAVFAFPLRIGAISPGVLDLYSSTPGGLNPEDLADAMAFADTATLVLLDARTDGAEGGAPHYAATPGHTIAACPTWPAPSSTAPSPSPAW
jgi:hypothetical protein